MFSLRSLVALCALSGPMTALAAEEGSAVPDLAFHGEVGFLGVLSFSAQRELPSFWDHDDNNLGYSNGQFVDLQIMFQNQTTPGWSSGLKYCDNVGLVHCA